MLPASLFHSTPFPHDIELHGLQPRPNVLRSHASFAGHPDPSIAARAADQHGAFVFASDSALESALYAFRVHTEPGAPQEPGITHMVAVVGLGAAQRGTIVVTNAEAWRAALDRRSPTRFTILPPWTERFRQVVSADGRATSEWVGATPVPPAGLLAERLSLADLNGAVDVLEWVADGPPQLDRPVSLLVAEGRLRPANARLGLAPAAPRQPTSRTHATARPG